MDTYSHKFLQFQINSSIGFSKYMSGKAAYLIRCLGIKIAGQSGLCPLVICDQRFNQNIDTGSIAPEITQIETWIQDYINNYDTVEYERDTKLLEANKWKLELLVLNGVDLVDDIERKVWQNRPDLLTDVEKDALIDEWELANP